MNKTLCTISLTLLFFGSSVLAQTDVQEITIGQRHTINSGILGEERSYSLYLPRGYEDSNARYPLLIALDGYYLWTIGIVDYLSFAGDIPQMIVLALDSSDRDRDFTPTNSRNLEGEEVPSSGGAHQFIRFLEEELLPQIEARYRLEPFRLLAGHSLGGLLCCTVLVENPDLFQAYLAMSPTLPWDNDWLIKQMEHKLRRHHPRQLFFSLGMDNQGGIMEESALAFMVKLKEIAPSPLEYQYNAFPNESHISCYQISLYTGLKSIYAPYKLPGELVEAGDAAGIERHYQGLTTRYGYPSTPSWEWLSFIAHWHELMNRLPQAAALFELAARYRPELADVHYSLAQVYKAQGFNEMSRAALIKALGCAPSSEERKKIEVALQSLE